MRVCARVLLLINNEAAALLRDKSSINAITAVKAAETEI